MHYEILRPENLFSDTGPKLHHFHYGMIDPLLIIFERKNEEMHRLGIAMNADYAMSPRSILPLDPLINHLESILAHYGQRNDGQSLLGFEG